MNERIKELLKQAGVKYTIMPKDTVYEKFAELIVKECCIVADVAGKQDLLASSVILDYFGLEE